MSHWSCCTRQFHWLRKEIVTGLSHTTTSHASSVAPKSWGVPSPTWRRLLRLSTTIFTLASPPWMSVYRYQILVIFTWTSAPSCPKWTNMSWPSSTPWRLSFWFRMNSSPRCQETRTWMAHRPAPLVSKCNQRNQRIGLLCCASHTITSPWSRSS